MSVPHRSQRRTVTPPNPAIVKQREEGARRRRMHQRRWVAPSKRPAGKPRWGGARVKVRAIGVKLTRLATAGALCGIVGVVIIYAAWRFFYPYAEELRTRREVAVLATRASALRAEQRRLQQQAKLLGTPEGIKLEARRLGLLRPGERSLRFMARPAPRGQQRPAQPARGSPAPDD